MGDNGNNNEKKNKGSQNNRSGMIFCLVAALIMVMMFFFMMGRVEERTNKSISYNEFLEMLSQGKVKEVKVDSDGGRIIIIPTQNGTAVNGVSVSTFYTGILEDGNKIQERCEAAGVIYSRVTVDKTNSFLQSILSYVIMFVLIYGVMFLVFRMLSKNGGGMMGVGKSNAKVYVEKD